MEGVPILGTLDGTPAARAGVRYGDVLLSVNGVRTRSVVDYVEAKNLRQDGMTLSVLRGGETIELSFVYDAPAASVDPTSLLATLVKLRIASPDDGEGSDEPSS